MTNSPLIQQQISLAVERELRWRWIAEEALRLRNEGTPPHQIYHVAAERYELMTEG